MDTILNLLKCFTPIEGKRAFLLCVEAHGCVQNDESRVDVEGLVVDNKNLLLKQVFTFNVILVVFEEPGIHVY